MISVITEAELLSAKRCQRTEEREKIASLMSIFRKVELDNEIAKIAAEFRRKYGTRLLDSIIAATAYRENCPVLTKNLKDFERIKEVKFESP